MERLIVLEKRQSFLADWWPVGACLGNKEAFKQKESVALGSQ